MRVIYWFLGLAVLLVAVLLALSMSAREPGRLGMEGGRLRPCPGTPNCVVSEGEGASTEPLRFTGQAESAWQAARSGIESLGGTVRQDEGDYLWATFTSRVFRFVDDVELRLDRERETIHLRSASRVGHSDLGVNARRVEALRTAFRQRIGGSGE